MDHGVDDSRIIASAKQRVYTLARGSIDPDQGEVMTNTEGTGVDANTIKASSLGSELTDAQCEKLAGVAAACAIRDGEFLIEEGQKDEAIHILVDGHMEAVARTAGGEWVTLQLLREGDMVGEMGFIDGVEHSASLRALGNCELIRLERGSFEELLKTDTELTYKVMRAIVREVHRILRGMNTQYMEMSNYISRQHGRY
jgi:CRP-like cAMP-binding protein